MTDYDIDIREIEPEYKHTLAKTANREVEDGFEVHLSRLTVTVALTWSTGHRRSDGQTFAVTFNVDHEAETVTTQTVGDAHSECQRFGVEKLTTALEYAEDAAVAFIEDVGPDYVLVDTRDHIQDAGDHINQTRVHTELEVAADD
jgi:hypothetical protein